MQKLLTENSARTFAWSKAPRSYTKRLLEQSNCSSTVSAKSA